MTTTKSTLFSEYNRTKAQLRSDGLETGRLDRALGVAQLKEPRPYITTLRSCTCPDFKYRHVECKHIKALKLQSKAREAEILKELGF